MTTKEKKEFYTIFIERMIFNGYNITEYLFNPPVLKKMNFKSMYTFIMKIEMECNDWSENEFRLELPEFTELYQKAVLSNLI